MIHRYVADRDVPLGPLLRLKRIEPDLERDLRRFGPELGQIEYVLRHVAGVAVLVWHGVTHLTTDLFLVQNVLRYVLTAATVNRIVATDAPGTLLDGVPVDVLDTVAVHLVAGVTRFALHVLLLVHVRRHSFILPEKLVFHPATVACGTRFAHGGAFLDVMPREQSAVDSGRAADVTLPAAGMA